ncbi:MAG: ABC transporter substrate-binding protein [Mycobacterium sp.]
MVHQVNGIRLRPNRLRSEARRRWRAALAAAAVVAVVVTGCGTDGKPASEATSSGDRLSLVVGVRDVSVPQAALNWMVAQGYFEDAGLDVTIKIGEAAHTSQLVAGQVDLYQGAQGGLFGIINSGKQVKTIYGVDAGISGWVVASNESVKTPSDCKSVTTATPGTVFYAWTKQLERIYDADWQLTQLTSVPAITANVVGGRTDCATGNISYFQRGIDEGRLRVIFDPSDESNLPPGWPTLGVDDVIGGIPATLAAKKPAVEKFLKTYAAAMPDYLAADPKDIAQALMSFNPKFAAVGSRDVLAKGVENFKPLLSPNSGYISDETWSHTVDFFRQGGLDFLGNDPSRFDYANVVDMSYYDAAIGRQ